ncbi:hypothetical protein PFUGPA_00079 [Plasmodium falciparum Palo Alto/Uganda]|uniref:dolichol kinase n=1 Tax=Plasmodium falciparum (isolate Palo Alto / Uganda) TaxID=57270 RepID=W4J8J3_PLAFP|nr:hypothetical protein PFUGPA_00079 [Plasmodium falciparum Palo Alto/Uganda]
MLSGVYDLFMEHFGMINILVILIITITQVKKKIFLCSCFTYIWILLTVLCNILIVSYMYHEKNKKKTKKEKNIEKEEKKYKNKNIYTILHPFIKIGKYYENEKETIMFDKNKRNFFSLYQNNKISIVDVLIIFLSFCFFLFIFVELIRKICEHFLPSCKVIKRFISRFIDERDNKGLVVTHIYLLTGVYIPILIDIIFNKSNYINRKNQSIYNFSKANFTLYTSALNTICIGDSMAAIGGMLYPWPKIKNTNNKSCAGSLFFFISTFISLLVFNYPFEVIYNIFVKKKKKKKKKKKYIYIYIYIHDIILYIYSLVPSDITLLEYKYSKNNEKKKINSLKKFFIYLSFFTFGNNCNKLDSEDVIHILSNVYSDNKICDDDKLNSFNILDILNTRQKDIDKQVIENIKKFKFSIMYKEHIKFNLNITTAKPKLLFSPLQQYWDYTWVLFVGTYQQEGS